MICFLSYILEPLPRNIRLVATFPHLDNTFPHGYPPVDNPVDTFIHLSTSERITNVYNTFIRSAYQHSYLKWVVPRGTIYIHM